MKFEFNEKAFLSAMKGSIQRAAEEQVVAKLSSIRCPTHGQTPRNIRFEGSILSGSQARIDCCCDRLKEAVKQALQ